MKKSFYLILIFFISLSAFFMFCNYKNDYLDKDKMLAVSLDGEVIDYLPTRGKYHIDIDCKNAKGLWDVDNWKLELKDITGNIKCNIDFETINNNHYFTNIVKQDDDIRENNGYRYIGNDPNNYIWYNKELWRIIGSIPTKKSNGTTVNLVKIIRNESLSVINFHYEDWANSFWDDVVTTSHSYTSWKNTSLWKVLNENYYGKKDATTKKYNDDGFLGFNLNSEICRLYKPSYSTYGKCNYSNNGIYPGGYYAKMIEEAYWNIGKITDSNDPNGLFSSFNCGGEISQTVKSLIGLASCSDYQNIYRDKNNDLIYRNWMSSKGIQYLISPYSDTEVFYISENGAIYHTYVYNPMQVFPALYLKENVYVVSGDGSITDPYKIAM